MVSLGRNGVVFIVGVVRGSDRGGGFGGVGGEASGLGGKERRRRGGDVDGESGTQEKVHFEEAKKRERKRSRG